MLIKANNIFVVCEYNHAYGVMCVLWLLDSL